MARPYLTPRDEATLRASVRQLLTQDPKSQSSKRREMDPNPLGATWELRIGDLRAYYDIDESSSTVWILRVGHKRRDRVHIRGEQVNLRGQR